MSDVLIDTENMIKTFSITEQISLMAFLANIIKEKSIDKTDNIETKLNTKKIYKNRRAGIGKDPNFWMADDFDAPLECFQEYM